MPPSAAAQVLHVTPAEVGRTVAALLKARLPDCSWNQVNKLLRARQVQINGNLCQDAGRRLKAAEVVRVLAHSVAPPPREEDVRICYLDRDLVVVEKPSGVTSVRHAEERDWSAKRKQLQPTLEDMLPRIIAKRLAGGKSAGKQHKSGKHAPAAKSPTRTVPVRPVHRLDRDTSGVMAFARTVPAERHLGQQFRAHTTGRRYLAVVHGDVAAQTIESHLARDRGDGRRGSTREAAEGKRAVTHIAPLERLGDYTLIECRLETGRTHQIRIHLSELGHPLCGDKVYYAPPAGRTRGKSSGRSTPDKSGAPRLALHAADLSLVHPTTGETMHFNMPLPPDLEKFIARLREGK